MTDSPEHQITLILDAIGAGDTAAKDELIPLVYEELRRMAGARMAREKPGQTLQPTALVHEAFLRLFGRKVRAGRIAPISSLRRPRRCGGS